MSKMYMTGYTEAERIGMLAYEYRPDEANEARRWLREHHPELFAMTSNPTLEGYDARREAALLVGYTVAGGPSQDTLDRMQAACETVETYTANPDTIAPFMELVQSYRQAFREDVRSGDLANAFVTYDRWREAEDGYGRASETAATAARALGIRRMPWPVASRNLPRHIAPRGGFADELTRAAGDEPYRAPTPMLPVMTSPPTK